MTVGKIERLLLRDVWRHEAHDFTRWLEENVDVLNDVIDLGLSSAEREKSAGVFSVDLVAEDAEGGTVIIENQLGRGFTPGSRLPRTTGSRPARVRVACLTPT